MENTNKPSPKSIWGVGLALALTTVLVFTANAERINQEGRILGPEPVVTTPTLFNTSAADAIVNGVVR